jgi:hypothetical protein
VIKENDQEIFVLPRPTRADGDTGQSYRKFDERDGRHQQVYTAGSIRPRFALTATNPNSNFFFTIETINMQAMQSPGSSASNRIHHFKLVLVRPWRRGGVAAAGPL